MTNETQGKSDAENLVGFFESMLPSIVDRWQELRGRGYQARMRGEPRMYHGRRGRGAYFLGWDEADSETREIERGKQILYKFLKGIILDNLCVDGLMVECDLANRMGQAL